MAVKLRAYSNAADCFLVWRTGRIEGCVGFAIERERNGVAEVLPNRLGFPGEQVAPGQTKPSTEWPYQRYDWTDHSLQSGEVARYRITPMLRAADELRQDEANRSDWSPEVELSGDGKGVSAHFNRGVLLSQFVTRELHGDLSEASLRAMVQRLAGQEDGLRRFLGGTLLREVVAMLQAVRDDAGLELHAALYELEDDQLIGLLRDIGARAHLILANGSAKTGDGNQKAADALAGTAVDLHRRMVPQRHLGHNKFALVTRGGVPERLLTGSTNWAKTGLCTQVNNALFVGPGTGAGGAIMGEYRRQWDSLLAAGNGFPHALTAGNDAMRGGNGENWDLWFTPTTAGQDLAWARDLIASAKRSIHFLMFNPGTDGLLQPVLDAQAADSGLTVLGVVNQLNLTKSQGAGAERHTVRVQLVSPDFARSFPLQVIEPEGLREGLGPWAAEITRRDFLGPSEQHPAVGHAIVHAKVLVIDGLTDDCVVVTGSHNFSKSASGNNDENLLAIRGDRLLAERYLVEISSVYEHYRWRAYLREHNGVRSGLDPTPGWQDRKLNAAEAARMATWVP